MDELDLDTASADEINEIESRLYGMIHHDTIVFEDRTGADVGAGAAEQVSPVFLPPPPSKRVITQTRVDNRPTSNVAAASPNSGRYWNKTSQLQNQVAATKVATDFKKIAEAPSPTSSTGAIKKQSLMQSPTAGSSNSPKTQLNKAKQSTPNQAKNHNALNFIKFQNETPPPTKSKKQQQQPQQWNQPNMPQKKFTKGGNQVVAISKKEMQQLERRGQQQQQQRFKGGNGASKGPFGKQSLKLEKLKRIDAKKEKSKLARKHFIDRQKEKQEKPVEFIQLDSSSDELEDRDAHPINNDDDDEDDVIFVPLSPPKIIELNDDDDYDDDEEEKEVSYVEDKQKANIKPKEEQLKKEEEQYIEENALDASDVQLDKATINSKSPPEASYATPARQQQSNSPCSSVLSSDDFIGQTDRRRLNGEHLKNVQADDEDLLLLTADVNSTFLKPVDIEAHAVRAVAAMCNAAKKPTEKVSPTQVEQDSETEFVPPTNLDVIKENYRVEPSQFRALDVYESESDFNESSVYSKTMPNNKSTVIRSVDSSCDDEELNDIQIVETNNMQQNKTKRLRKRRASSAKDSDSVSHVSGTGIASESDSDTDDGVRATGIPFIVHGPAVERCKSRARKLGTHSHAGAKMSDNRFLQSLQNLAKGEQQTVNDQSDTESDEESSSPQAPTARDIAERVLKKHKRSKSVEAPQQTTQIDIVPDSSDDLEIQQSNFIESSDSDVEVITNNARSDPKIVEKVQPRTNSRKAKAPELQVALYERPLSPLLFEPSFNRQAQDEAENEDDDLLVNKDLFYMNDEMAAFYEMSWGGEDFTLDDCLSKMNYQRQNWRLQPNDRFPKSNSRNSNLKCLNCCEFGHIRSKCKFPKKPIVCSTCGNFGHKETRCPFSICLGCGHQCPLFVRSCNNCSFQRRLICPLCKMRGHSLNYCPDKWRRYHSTTEPNGQLVSDVKYKKVKHCSICGTVGHLSENCRLTPRFMDYPIISSIIKSHQKVYNDVSNPSRLVSYKVHVPYHINWSIPLKKDGYYNRMLRAVGLWKRYKRKPLEKPLSETPVKKLRLLEKSYVKNPYAEMAQKARQAKEQAQALSSSTTDEIEIISPLPPPPSQSPPPNQVPEISESGSVVELLDLSDNTGEDEIVQSTGNEFNISDYQVIDEIGGDGSDDGAGADDNVEQVASPNGRDDSFKMPKSMEVEEGGDDNLVSSNSITNSNSSIDPMVVMDSDSNYSFSEHFEMPSSTTNNNANNSNTSHPMDNLPEMIPLRMEHDDHDFNEAAQRPIITGISMCLSGESAPRDRDNAANYSADEVPSEAKIFMLRSDTDYLFSAEGRLFLNDISKECNVAVRIDLTSCGYALIITGLPSNQQKLHMLVLKRCKDVRNKTAEFQSQKPPRRADVLIRYLRDGVCQLLGKLGNAHDLYKLLKYNENLNTKQGYKLADKKRRLLNMILLGQAGLLNGNLHLDELLVILKKLITDYKLSDIVPEALRNQVETHWRMIFTSYVHSDYPNLLQLYRSSTQRNRLIALNIEPWILGQKMQNPTEEQKARSANFINLNDSNPQSQKKVINHQQPSTSSTEDDAIPPPPPPFLKSPIMNNSNNTNNNGKNSSGKNNNKTFSSRTNITAMPTNANGGGTSTPGKTFGNRQQQQQQQQQQINYPGNNNNNYVSPNNQRQQSHQQQQQINYPGNKNNNYVSPNKQRQQHYQQQQQKGQHQQLSKTPPCVNPQQRSNANLQLHTLFQQPQNITDNPNNNNNNNYVGGGGEGNSASANMLAEIDSTSTTPNKSSNTQHPTLFWSRESMKFIDACIRITSNPVILNGLRRVQNKARGGQLSQNDYWVVRQLHNTLTSN